MVFDDANGHVWEVRDFTPSLSKTPGSIGVAHSRRPTEPAHESWREIQDNYETWAAQQASNAIAPLYNLYTLGHPHARRRAFLFRHTARDAEQPPDRFCELNTVSDHRWYAATLAEQLAGSKLLHVAIRQRLGEPVEDMLPVRQVPLQFPEKTHSRAPLFGWVFEDAEGGLWRVRDLRYRRGRRRPVVSEFGSPMSEARLFEPWEHVAQRRIYKFPDGAGTHPISDGIATEFQAARPSGTPRDFSG